MEAYGGGDPGSNEIFGNSKINKLIQILEEKFPYINVREIEENLKYSIIIPIDERDITKDVIKLLEDFKENEEHGGFNFNVNSNSLEDIVIKTTEEEFNTDLNESFNSSLNEKIQTLINATRAAKTKKSRFSVLFLRRIKLLYKNPVQFFSFLIYIICPWIFCYAVSNKNIKVKASKHGIYYLIEFIVTFLLLICSYYGIIIVYERKNLLRFYLKINNISSSTYIFSTMIADVIIGTIAMIFIVTGCVFILNSKGVFEVPWTDARGIFAILALWKGSFILQHYFIAYFLRKTTQVTSFTNLIIILFSFFSWIFIGIFSRNAFGRFFFEISNPLTLIFKFCNSEIKQNDDGKNYVNIIMKLFLSVLFWFTACVIVDYVKFYTRKRDGLTALKPVLNGEEITPFIPESIQEEKAKLELQVEGESDILRVKNLAHAYYGFGTRFYAVHNFNLAMKKGEIVGLLGPNGSGKTTTFGVLCSFLQNFEGEIYYKGKKNKFKTMLKDAGLCFQKDVLWDDLSVWDHVKFIGGLKGMRNQEIMKQWLCLFGLQNFLKKKA